MMTMRTLTALPVACLLLGGAADGQTRRAVTLVDLLEVPRLSDPRLSPDGDELLYVTGRSRLGGEPGHQPYLASRRRR